MKEPQRGEIWKDDNVDMYYYVVSIDKFSVNSVIKYSKPDFRETYTCSRIGKYTFVRNKHFVSNAMIDVADLFKEFKQ